MPAGKVRIISGPDWFPTFVAAASTLSAARIGDDKFRFTDQPTGWFGPTEKVDWPIITNLRLDPWERTGLNQSISYVNWYMYEFWRGVFVQPKVA